MAGRGRTGQVSPGSEFWFSESWCSGQPFFDWRLGSDVTVLMSLTLLVPVSLASLSRSPAQLIQEPCFVLQNPLCDIWGWTGLV